MQFKQASAVKVSLSPPPQDLHAVTYANPTHGVWTSHIAIGKFQMHDTFTAAKSNSEVNTPHNLKDANRTRVL